MGIDRSTPPRHTNTIFFCLKNGALDKNTSYQINMVMGGGTFLKVAQLEAGRLWAYYASGPINLGTNFRHCHGHK